MPFIDAEDQTRIHYHDLGTGRPLVLIHGWPLSSAMWEYQLNELPKHGIRCIAYDRRGFGHSEKPWSGYDYDTLASDLNNLIEQLGLRGVTLAGFSMGGGEVARYLGRYGTGDRVSKAMLIGSVTPFLLKTAENKDGVDKSVFDGMIDGILKDRPGFLQAFGKQFYGAGLVSSPVSSAFLEWTSMLALAASGRATTECVKSFSETDFRADLAKISVPTLVIHGDNDKTVPLDVSGRLSAKAIAGAELKVYEGAPHGLIYTHKDKLNKDISDFVLRS